MTTKIKLNPRAYDLLILIADYSTCEDDGPMWIPAMQDGLGQWSPSLHRHIEVSGAGDANAIKGLIRKGLIRHAHFRNAMSNPYQARVTEEGRQYVERLREAGELEQV
jgi:hypothetical protein